LVMVTLASRYDRIHRNLDASFLVGVFPAISYGRTERAATCNLTARC